VIFWEKLRGEIQRYAEGVHELGPPAPVDRDLPPLPEALAELYRSFDGLRLFTDSFVIVPASAVVASGDRFGIGEALGAPLEIDAAGRLFERDDAGDSVLVGSTLGRWLDATLAREKLVVDREGEYKEVFADGAELAAEVRKKRARAALKADPAAAAWHLEAAELAFEDGREDEARSELVRAVELDGRAGAAWVLLGGLYERAQKWEPAADAYARAAESSQDGGRRAERFAEAARMTRRPELRAKFSAASRGADEGAAARWRAEAERRLQEDPDGALRLAELAQAVGAGAEELVKRARVKAQLKVF
jgi:tetratricopeptide (TPR) repeat protein